MIIVEGIDYITIPATNPEASADFYVDLFDFEIVGEKSADLVRISLDPFQLQLSKVESAENSLSANTLPTLSFAVDVDDFTEAINEIESKEINIVKGPEGSSNGGERLIIADPDNNLIEIFYNP